MHNIEKTFLSTLEQYGITPSKDSPLLLAISGGKDSMVLLHVAHLTLPGDTYKAIYINHGIRPESAGDGEFIRAWCGERNIVFLESNLSLDLSHVGNLESRAREARYCALHEVATLYHSPCIVTAHHQADQSETIMMRWLSGSSLTGLAGMQAFSGGILRPFLTISQAEILSYICEYHILWREDSTNESSAYRRNWLRNEILPQVREKYVSFDNKMSEFAEYARSINEYIEMQVKNFLEENNFLSDRGFGVDSFQKQHKALRSSIIAHLYSQVH